ncbi:molybdopterin-binding protein [Alisedimentitalea sp. MJ-SS2]|uniref:molybdenum cofactor synthesis domain-containing protein n=1 Tax=Aliisedimentitalea sp. MJ-SS2 TaxID=3049795 RepID=UPI002908319F|nr:gephyrin-like molybdotransferase Glp [Alisedimentitalea sp. MJ-SS2]MDU8928441.1 molybdopterin-binding protein [Alisedimentitalea sp. MJ-SS2]
MVDWSGGNDRGAKPKADAIWTCVAGEAAVYHRNRNSAEDWLRTRIGEEIDAGRRVLAGFDFPFGYPNGLARALVGKDDPLTLWQWFADRIEDDPKGNNRFDVAGRINRLFDGTGPFWGNGLKRDVAGLPRKGRARDCDALPEWRLAEARARGAFSCWQMAGAGSVGGQMMMGLPVLWRLREAFGAAAWPFEPLDDAPLALVEVWPSLIRKAVAEGQREGEIKDAAQVRVLVAAIAALDPDVLAEMLAVEEPQAREEGWIFGLGYEPAFEAAARQALALKPPALKDDCFALPPGVDWAPVDDALALLENRLSPVTATEVLPLEAVLGRTLAAPVVAKRSNPPLPNTAVDGYGFAHSSLPEGDPVLPLVAGRAAAGIRFDGTVPPGHAIRILTGAALPEGVDTVVLQEDVQLGAGEVAFRAGVRAGANTRCAGEDVEAGQEILAEGRVLTAPDLALIAATGGAGVTVRKPLKVAVVSTGDELVDPGQPAGPGQIFDANRPMLLALIERAGHVPVDMGRVPDNRASLRATLDEAARTADAILTSGGASAGDEDHVSALLGQAGAMALWRMALKPGRPLALGLWNGAPVFGLPGNPVAAMVTACVFGLPALGLLAGRGWRKPQGFQVPAAFAKRKKPGRREYLRARIRDGRVEVFKSEGSGRVSGLSWAEGLVELPDGALVVEPGDPVTYIPWSGFGI